MAEPTDDDPRRRASEALQRVLRSMPPRPATEQRGWRSSDLELDGLLWTTSCVVMLLLALLDLITEHTGYLPSLHQARLRLMVVLGAFGLLAVFPDRVASWLQARLKLERGVSPRWIVVIGVAGFAAIWCLGALSGTTRWRAYPLLVVPGLGALRLLSAWAARAARRRSWRRRTGRGWGWGWGWWRGELRTPHGLAPCGSPISQAVSHSIRGSPRPSSSCKCCSSSGNR